MKDTMNWLPLENGGCFSLDQLPLLGMEQFRTELHDAWESGGRIVDFHATPVDGKTRLIAVFHRKDERKLQLTSAEPGPEYPSLTPIIPCLNVYEREIAENTGIVIVDHPWPKPLRKLFSEGSDREIDVFLKPGSEEMHEVAVGPVHAGIIEPGHFRFLCHGEKIYHLEIQLGYQHRGVGRLMEEALRTGPPGSAACLAESIAGDTAIGHSWAHAALVEAMNAAPPSDLDNSLRSIALEMERAAVHIGDLAALAGDIAFLPGHSFFGSFRTLVINTMLEWSGNRFGRGLIRAGRTPAGIDDNLKRTIDGACRRTEKKVRQLADSMFTSASVLSRMEKCGIISQETARDLGLTGPAARASGYAVDSRHDHPIVPVPRCPAPASSLCADGDVFARAYIRYLEIGNSLANIRLNLENLPPPVPSARTAPAARMRRNSMAVAVVEGWRGEIAHTLITDKNGQASAYRIKDPSLANWAGLARAIRENPISDFPLCNKSFSLSYCGHDL